MKDKKETPQEGIYALVSGAGALVTKDGLLAVILVEEVKLPQSGTMTYKSTIFGPDPAIVLLRDKKTDKWHVTGPVDDMSKEDLLRLAEGLRLLAEKRPGSGK